MSMYRGTLSLLTTSAWIGLSSSHTWVYETYRVVMNFIDKAVYPGKS